MVHTSILFQTGFDLVNIYSVVLCPPLKTTILTVSMTFCKWFHLFHAIFAGKIVKSHFMGSYPPFSACSLCSSHMMSLPIFLLWLVSIPISIHSLPAPRGISHQIQTLTFKKKKKKFPLVFFLF